MRKTKQKGLYGFIAAVSIILAMSFACAASVPDDMGMNQAAFLKIDAATRPSGMGGAFVGLANDINSVFWNPAGLAEAEKREFTAMYNAWFAGMSYGSSAYSQPLSKNAAFAISTIYLQSKIERRSDDTLNPDSTFNAHSLAAGISGSYALLPKMFLLGGTVKVVNEDFDVDSSTGVAADLGCLLHIAKMSVGASLQNLKIHSSIEDGSLPLGLRAGISYPFSQEAVIAAEFTKLGAGNASYHFGMEKWFKKILALRVGYCLGSGDNAKDGLSAGFGLRAYGTKPLEDMNFQLDYAYVPERNGLGDTHRVSMIVRF